MIYYAMHCKYDYGKMLKVTHILRFSTANAYIPLLVHTHKDIFLYFFTVYSLYMSLTQRVHVASPHCSEAFMENHLVTVQRFPKPHRLLFRGESGTMLIFKHEKCSKTNNRNPNMNLSRIFNKLEMLIYFFFFFRNCCFS